MTTFNYTNILTQAVDELSESQSYKGLFHQHKDGDPLPSAKSLYKIVELARAIIFPGYFGNSTVNSHTINYHIGVNVETLFGLLTEQILAGLCFGQENSKNATDDNEPCRETASLLAARFISKLPELRRILATDVEAAYYGDPAATCFGEIISCYPAIRAISNYRIAHELLILGVPLIPRFITEMAHSETGIDIHPGAQIGHSERRQYYGETSATLNKKMAQAFANGLQPIYCVGENLEEREADRHFDVVKTQIEEVIYNLTPAQFARTVIAYEPVWAIGTGKTATAEQAQEIHAYIRTILREKFGAAADETPILYGGSCKPSNAPELFAKEDVDGGLIGGAALKAADFLAIGKGFPQK